MQASETTFPGTAGATIARRSWLPSTEATAVAVVVHGMSEHSGRYGQLASRLNEIGFAVYAPDHRGHGRSSEPRKFIDSFNNVVADLALTVKDVKSAHPGLPVVIIGHSMGGAVSLKYVLDHPDTVDALITSGAATRISDLPKGIRPALHILTRALPKLPVGKVDASVVSRDKSEIEKYQQDPLVEHKQLPVRTVAGLTFLGDEIRSRLGELKLPLLVLHGGDDKIVPALSSQEIYEQASSTDKTVKIYPSLYHEIFNELPEDRELVFADLSQWLRERF